ncbi:hypothetical protein ACQ4M3_12600 [Leptolyngbya sp. AN03gr2]|uniref:hypothetical protein n=1 Tax=unclassified Leptolyngbya TaxID=2650499 RepID=UPI003D3123A6
MKASVYDLVKTLTQVQSDFKPEVMIPAGTIGTVIECYEQPEGYAVDLAIPNEQLVGGYEYHNVILSPQQFVVIKKLETPEKIAG